MSDEEQKKIFSININRYISLSGKQQKEVAKDLEISPTTFNTWCVGRIIPSMGKVQMIADYFHIGKSDLLEKKDDTLTARDKRDIKDILSNTEELLQQDGLMFDGEPASPDAVDSILSAMKIGMEMAKQKNKEKYTPKKYKKD